MGLKQQLLDMGLNVFGLDLFVESYNKTIMSMLKSDPDFPKDKLNLEFTYPCRKSDERNGDCEITMTFKQVKNHKANEEDTKNIKESFVTDKKSCLQRLRGIEKFFNELDEDSKVHPHESGLRGADTTDIINYVEQHLPGNSYPKEKTSK